MHEYRDQIAELIDRAGGLRAAGRKTGIGHGHLSAFIRRTDPGALSVPSLERLVHGLGGAISVKRRRRGTSNSKAKG